MNPKERKLQGAIRRGNRTPFRRERASERASLRIKKWLRQRRIYRGIRHVPFMPYEEDGSKDGSGY